jgi:hypothetical protein
VRVTGQRAGVPGAQHSRPRAARVAVWFAALVAAWAALVGDSTADIWVAGGVAAFIAAMAAYGGMRRGLLDHTFRRGWWGLLVRALWEVPVDFIVVTGALVRAVRHGQREIGQFVPADFEAGGDTPRGRSWRAFAVFASSWSPNAYVIDIDRKAGRRLTHDLVPRTASERPV